MRRPPRRCRACWRCCITATACRCIGPADPFEQESRAGESRPPFEDDTVYYYGQFVALVVANTFEQANAAAAAVKVEYATEKPAVVLEEEDRASGDPKQHYQRGNAEEAFASAPVKLDAVYETPTETHNPMEMHGTIAEWNGDRLRLYETTQGVVNHRNVMSEMLGRPAGPHRGHLAVLRVRIRRQAVSVAAVDAGGHGGEKGGPAGAGDGAAQP